MSSVRTAALFILAASTALPACAPAPSPRGEHDESLEYNELNLAAGQIVLYEAQARTANACRADFGSDAQRAACAAKPAPAIPYRAEGLSCAELPYLSGIRLGTLDDMLADSADFRAGITVRYVADTVGANALWLMPLFPNNDRWGLPDACDNLGSPYAVRDYFHVAGTLSRSCIAAGRDEYSDTPCWGNDVLDRLIAQAHGRGVKVLLDVALNHFGHNYLFYDVAGALPVRERVARGDSLDGLWDFAASYDEALLHPALADDPAALAGAAAATDRAALAAVRARCPSLSGQPLVRTALQWRDAFDWERTQLRCGGEALEYQLPGYYLGGNNFDPSRGAGDNFTNNWTDVKFLYHHEDNAAHRWEYARTREYVFRVLDYWLSRGVDGFRLDHTTDFYSGLTPNEWKYVTSKLDYYAWRRGQPRPIFLAEEFGDQGGMSHVADILTEGYVGDLTGRNGQTKDAWFVQRVVDNTQRFGGHTFVMSALETHDEKRLLDGTGFDVWTGAGFWGIGATTWSTPMILAGQEFGEGEALGFRKSAFLPARFAPPAAADALTRFYRDMIRTRLQPENRALRASHYRFLPRRDGGGSDGRIYAAAKWSDDGNVVFVAHNLWQQDVAQSYYLPPDLAQALLLQPDSSYRLVDALSGLQLGACRRGADLAWDFYVAMGASTRLQWMRLEQCH